MVNELAKMDLSGARCLLRVDLNVPLDPADFTILSDERLVRVVPVIELLLKKGASVVLMSHLGRPKGKRMPEYSMKVVQKRLSQILGKPIIDAKGSVSDETLRIVRAMQPGEIALLENLRFFAGEEANDPQFAADLAKLGDFYVNDAFGVSHRAHASVVTLPTLLPSAAGPLLESEITQIGNAIKNPTKPAVAIVGGAKIADKTSQLLNIAQAVERILLGGGMVGAFLKLQGCNSGGFEVTDDDLAKARQLTALRDCEITIPTDFKVIKTFSANAPARVVTAVEIEPDDLIMDIGDATAKQYTDTIRAAKTVVWNGPVGYYEWAAYQVGTLRLAKAIANLQGATTVAGGGSTLSVIADLKIHNKLTHVSTGGGAFLKMLAGEPIVGYEALKS